VEIDVLHSGNDTSTGSWDRNVAGAIHPGDPKTVHGNTYYEWSTAPLRIFDASRWPDGGTARVRFRAVRSDGNEAYLRVRDRHGVDGNLHQLVLADPKPTPVDDPPRRPKYLGKKTGTHDFVDPVTGEFDPVLAEAATESYYKTVRTDSFGQDPTKTIWNTLPTLAAFKARYFDPARASVQFGPDVPAVYYNRGDLGLGREMHCMVNIDAETACYVLNFGDRDANVRFGDEDEAFEAIRVRRPFATVAMVERGKMPFDVPNRIFFAVYGGGDVEEAAGLQTAAQLDVTSHNTFIPGNCLVCHGAGSTYDAEAAEVRGAFFLPFDLEQFHYASDDRRNPLSRAAQERAFKRLNQIALNTSLHTNRDVVNLISSWYGPPGGGLPLDTFQDNKVPAGWLYNADGVRDENRRQLYLRVVAPSCRTCHITNIGPDTNFFEGDDSADTLAVKQRLRFARYDDFKDFADTIYEDVCGTRRSTDPMPNAERTAKNFWRSEGRPQLLNRMGFTGGCGLP
jgi:hypothetical protein